MRPQLTGKSQITKLQTRRRGVYIANLQAHPDLMRNADLIARRKDQGKEAPTFSELKLFYQRRLQVAGIEHKRQAGEVDLALTDADIEEILRARSPQPEAEVAPPPTANSPAAVKEVDAPTPVLKFSETIEAWYQELTAKDPQGKLFNLDYTLSERQVSHLFSPTPEQREAFIKARLAHINRLEDLDLTLSEGDLEEMFHDWLKMQIPERSFDQIQERFPKREDQIVPMVEAITSLAQFHEIRFTPPNSVEAMLYSASQYQSGVINFSGIVRYRGTYLIYENHLVLVVLPHSPKAITDLDYESPAVVAGFVRTQIDSIFNPQTGARIPVMVMSARRRADKQ